MIHSGKVCLWCEKPSQARSWAKALGGMSGTYKGQDYVICASRGFLYELVDPSDMVPKGMAPRIKNWDPKLLPWDTSSFDWKYKPRGKTKSEEADSKKTAQAMFDASRGCDEQCVAGDLDPAGTGFEIQWLNMVQTGAIGENDRISRAYFSDESVPALQKAFEERKWVTPMRDPELLKSLTRERFDLASMQWTRVLTGAVGGAAVLRTGRLKGAIVKLVGDQEDAVAAYVKKTVYQASFVDENGVRYIDESQPTFEREGDVDLSGLSPSGVTQDSKTRKKTAPPKLLDLATLSGRLAPLGIPSKTVLATYQKMYEAQVVSYPRTEDSKITHEQKEALAPLVDSICAVVGVDPKLLTHRQDRKTHIGEGLAHGANRPGPNVPKSLDELDDRFGRGAAAIYETLARSYLAMLAPDAEYDSYKGHVTDFPSYKGSVAVNVKPGWRAVFDAQDDDEAAAKGLGTHAEPAVRSITNKKPPAPTLKWLFAQLGRRDIGTGATRTSTAADVSSGGKYPLMKESKGKLSLTEYGRMEHALLDGTRIADLDLTKRLQDRMDDVAHGRARMDDVVGMVAGLIADDIPTVEENAKRAGIWAERTYSDREQVSGKFKGKTVSFDRICFGHRLTDDEVARLLAGETIMFAGTAKSGRPFTAYGGLGKHTYKGKTYFGFNMADGYPPRDALTPVFHGHVFDDEETEALRAGRTIAISDMTDAKGKAYGRVGVSFTEGYGLEVVR